MFIFRSVCLSWYFNTELCIAFYVSLKNSLTFSLLSIVSFSWKDFICFRVSIIIRHTPLYHQSLVCHWTSILFCKGECFSLDSIFYKCGICQGAVGEFIVHARGLYKWSFYMRPNFDTPFDGLDIKL